MAQPRRPRRPASDRAKAIAFGLTAVLLAITAYMFITGPSGGDFAATSDSAAPMENATDALQSIADSIDGQ